MNSTLPTELKPGDLAVHTYKGEDELVQIVDNDGTFTVIAYGPLTDSTLEHGNSKTYEGLRQWIRLGGRHASHIACSNPQPVGECPACIYRVTHFGKRTQRIKAAHTLPPGLTAQWNKATDDERTMVIRKHVKFLYDMSHTRSIRFDSDDLTKLVERKMSLPFRAPFSTQL